MFAESRGSLGWACRRADWWQMTLDHWGKARARMYLICVLGVVLANCSVAAEQEFPQVRVSTTLQQGVWLKSPIVAVGNVTNIASYGKQTVEQLPAPTMPDLHDLYWCQGIFSAVAVVKGDLKGNHRKYLWGSTIPGCELVDNDPKLIYHRFNTKIWFLREEGDFLRPTFDYETFRFMGIFTSWSQGPHLPARRRLGTLLLTPTANNDSLDDFANYLWNIGDIACDLLGKPECIRQIRNLQELGNPTLRLSACNFLQGQLGVDCPAKVNANARHD